MTQEYKVTREFLSGPLAGLTHTGITSAKYEVGYVCEKPIGGSPYVIRESTPIARDRREHDCPTCGSRCRCDVPRQYCVHCA